MPPSSSRPAAPIVGTPITSNMAGFNQASLNTGSPTPSSPTVMSDSTIRNSVIPGLNSQATNIANNGSGGATNNTTTSGTNGGGSSNSDNSGTDYNSIYQSLVGDNGESTGNSELALLNSMKGSGDAQTQASLSAIESQYAIRQQNLQNSQASTTKADTNALELGGASRYAPISANGILSAKEGADIQQLNSLQSDENAAKQTVIAAQQSQDFELLSKSIDVYNQINQNKTDLAKTIVQNMKDENAAKLEQSKFAEQQKQDNFNNTIALSDQKLKEAGIDLQTKQLAESTRHDQAEEGIAAGQLRLSQQSLNFSEGLNPDGSSNSPTGSSPASFDSTGNLVDPTGKQVLSATQLKTSYGVTTTPTGVTYINISLPMYQGDTGKAMLIRAKQLGIPMLDADQSATVDGLGQAMTLLNQLNATLNTEGGAFSSHTNINTIGSQLKDTLAKLAGTSPSLSGLAALPIPNTFNDSAFGKIVQQTPNTKSLEQIRSDITSSLASYVGASNVPATGYTDPTEFQASSNSNQIKYAKAYAYLRANPQYYTPITPGAVPQPSDALKLINYVDSSVYMNSSNSSK